MTFLKNKVRFFDYFILFIYLFIFFGYVNSKLGGFLVNIRRRFLI